MILAFILSCENREKSASTFENSSINAEIIGFIPDKCFCCWGWEIKIGDTIIKADSLPDAAAVGYVISQPVPVAIETGKMKTKCSDGPDYYEIKSLTLK